MRIPFLLAAVLLGSVTPAIADGWSGRTGVEYLHFWSDPIHEGQYSNYLSPFVEPEYNAEWDDGKQQFNFTLFARGDSRDDNHQHVDVRELEYLMVGSNYALRAGVSKVFWGVTEAEHLVDIVNQSDLVENPDGDTKLGQPMLNLTLINGPSTLNLFVLPYFRDRTYPSESGRPRTRLVVDDDLATYEASNGRHHVDFATRWSVSESGLDLGLSYFYGTGRDPRLLPQKIAPGQFVLAPHYELLQQVGLDTSYVDGAMLWKLEAVGREQLGAWYFAMSAGFEYTFSGVFGSSVDIGLLSEYLYDNRGLNATLIVPVPPVKAIGAPPNYFQNDLLFGLRVGFNDVQSTQILMGIIPDLDGQGLIYSLKAERRLGETWKLNLEFRGYVNIPVDDVLYSQRNDDYIRTTLAWYF